MEDGLEENEPSSRLPECGMGAGRVGLGRRISGAGRSQQNGVGAMSGAGSPRARVARSRWPRAWRPTRRAGERRTRAGIAPSRKPRVRRPLARQGNMDKSISPRRSRSREQLTGGQNVCCVDPVDLLTHGAPSCVDRQSNEPQSRLMDKQISNV